MAPRLRPENARGAGGSERGGRGRGVRELDVRGDLREARDDRTGTLGAWRGATPPLARSLLESSPGHPTDREGGDREPGGRRHHGERVSDWGRALGPGAAPLHPASHGDDVPPLPRDHGRDPASSRSIAVPMFPRGMSPILSQTRPEAVLLGSVLTARAHATVRRQPSGLEGEDEARTVREASTGAAGGEGE